MTVECAYKIEYSIDETSGTVIATIPELNHLSSFGATFAEAETNVREAAHGYLEVILKERRDLPQIV